MFRKYVSVLNTQVMFWVCYGRSNSGLADSGNNFQSSTNKCLDKHN